MRLFIALDLPAETKQSIAEFIRQNKSGYPDCGHWVEPANLHLTVNFLGEVSRTILPELERAIASAGQSQTEFNLTITGFAWLTPASPRLGLLTIESSPDFDRLQHRLKTYLGQLGVKTIDRPPHLTLVRLNKNLTKAPNLFFRRQAFKASAIKLIHSTLTPNGPIYQPLKGFNLPYQGTYGPYRPNVAICLINGQNRLLVVKHPLSKSNYWQMLQGGIEAGETTKAAVKRELQEELGITEIEILSIRERVHSYLWPEAIRQAGEADKRVYIGQEQSLAVVRFNGQQTSMKPDPAEIAASRWVSVDEFLKYLQPVRRRLGKMALAEIKKLKLETA